MCLLCIFLQIRSSNFCFPPDNSNFFRFPLKVRVIESNNAGICSASWEGYNPLDFGDHVWWTFVTLKMFKKEVCQRIQHCCPNYAPTFSDHGTKDILEIVGSKLWPVSNLGQQFSTTRNNMEKGVQTDTTCNIQQCWELLANNAASVCTGLKASYVRTVQDSFCASLCNSDPPPPPTHCLCSVWRMCTAISPKQRQSWTCSCFAFSPAWIRSARFTVKFDSSWTLG